MALPGVIQPPPRLTGDLPTDLVALSRWFQSFYNALALTGIFGTVSDHFTLSDNEVAGTVTFPPSISQRADTNYEVIISPSDFSGSPPADAFIVKQIANKTLSSFDVLFRAAPGAGNSVTYGYTVAITI